MMVYTTCVHFSPLPVCIYAKIELMQERKKEIIKTVFTIFLLLIVVSGVFLSAKGNSVLDRVLGQSTSTHLESPSPTPQVTTLPSERALKAASYVYYTDNGANQDWVNKAYPLIETQIDNFRAVSSQQGYAEAEIEVEIKRKQGEETITKLALWLDANPNHLVEYEVAINKHQQALQNQYAQQPVQYAPDNSQINDIQSQVDEQKRKLQWELDEQKSKLEGLQHDLRMDCIRAGGSPIGNKCY